MNILLTSLGYTRASVSPFDEDWYPCLAAMRNRTRSTACDVSNEIPICASNRDLHPRLSSQMDPISLIVGSITICQVAGKIISLGFEYGQSISNLPGEVQVLVSEIALLSGVLNSLCSCLQNDGGTTATKFVTDSVASSVAECQQQLEELHAFLAKHQSSGSKLSTLGRTLKWPMKAQETREWIVKMERYKTTFSLALQREELGVSKKISGDVADIKTFQEREWSEKAREKQNKTFKSALSWMSPMDPRENHLASRKLQQNGTGKWFTQSKDFSRWKDTESSLLWLYGLAGSGKTILSSIILDRLLQEEGEAGASSYTKTVYFYCDFKDVNKASAVGVYGSLLAQILESYYDKLPTHLAEYYEKNHSRPPQEASIKQELLNLVGKVGCTRIVVDALDECVVSARMEVLKTLLEIQQAGKVNMLITSREEVDIKAVLADVPKVCVNAVVNSKDIQLFVTEECERNVKLRRRLKGIIKSEVISTVSSEAKGMFRWAKCTLDEISRLRNDKAIKQALKKLPPDLNETYQRILDGISPDDKELALRIVRWLTLSLQPMQIGALIEGIALELEDTALDPEKFLNDPEDICDICGSLVELNLDTRTVALAHFSVKEFFVSPFRRRGAHPEFFIEPETANFELAKLCVTYLKLEHFSTGPCVTGEELARRCESYELYRYASLQWPAHARAHVDVNDESFLSVIEPLFIASEMNPNFDSWIQAFEGISSRTISVKNNLETRYDAYRQSDSDAETNRLIYACRLGLYSLAKAMISKGIGLRAVTNENTIKIKNRSMLFKARGNALNAACESGDLKLVELVLSAGADVNAIAGCYGLALIAAIEPVRHSRRPKDYSIAQYLLEKGADVNLTTPANTWPLLEAVGCHSAEGVKLCLEAGADISKRQSEGYSVFENAALNGDAEIFELLRQYGGGQHVNPDIEEPINLTPGVDGYGLWLASASNFYESAQKILEADGETIFSDPAFDLVTYGIFIQCAASGFYKFLQQMLVYSGNSFKAYNECVKLSASQGHAKTLKILLDIKPPELEIDRHLCDLLVVASGRGYADVVRELITQGVPLFAPDKHGWTSMLAAATSARSQEIQNSTLDVFRNLANGFEKLESRVLKPTGWRLRSERNEVAVRRLTTEGTSAYLPIGESPSWITFDHPIPPSTSYYYFEVTVEKTLKPLMDIGIASLFTEHDSDGPSPICYSSNGRIDSPTSRRQGFRKLSEGSVIGCAVDLKKRIAVFTHDGNLIEASCSDVRGMVYGVVFMRPGDRIKVNLGGEPFVFDTTLFDKGLDNFAVEPKFVFRTERYVDPKMPDFGGPDQRFIG
ncbi:hypothetical protein BDD12DRAFT_844729 [Trichophaea hybrida]|nr:hypothetical protein BDD12DRAFT_844729 [Trichophaea hybrida]